MTATARMGQADMERAMKAAVKAAAGARARVVFRLDKREIEVIIGESAPDDPVPPRNPWDEE